MKATTSLAIAALCATVAPMVAQAVNWTGNGANTFWSTAENWDSLLGAGASLTFRAANPGNRTATLDGLYSYTVVTEKQRQAMEKAEIPYVYMNTYEMAYAFIRTLLGGLQ